MIKTINKFIFDLPKYLLATVLIIVPLFPKFPLFAIPGTYVAVRFEDVILLILGIITIIKIIPNLKFFCKDKIVVAFLLFFAVNLISLLSGIFLTKTVSIHIGILNYLRRAEYLIPFFAILVFFSPTRVKNNLSYYLKILMIVVAIAFLYGIGQRYLSFPIIITQNDTYAKGVALRWTPGSHINSTFAGHYDLAAFMVLVLPIFITFLSLNKDKLNFFWFFITSGSGLWLLVNSLSRISQVSYIVAVSMALILVKKYKALAVTLIISIIVIGTSSSLNARFMRVFDVFFDKVKSVNIVNISVKAQEQTLPAIKINEVKPVATPLPIFEDRSTSIRLKVEWPRAIRAFQINPLLGTGYSSITLATDNDFLRMLGETGLLGFMAFSLIVLRILNIFIQGIKILKKFTHLEKAFICGISGGVVGTFISAFFIDLFEASKFATLLWVFVGYAIVLIRTRINEQKI